MVKIIFTLLAVFILSAGIQAQTTVQAGVSLNGTSLVINAKPNGAISGNLSGGNVTIVWPTSYGVTLGAITNSIGTWSVQVSGTSGANTYSTIGLMSLATPIDWTNGSVNELFRIAVNQTGTGTGTFNVMNNVPDASGNWYFEVAGVERTNNGTPFFVSSVSNVPLPVELSSFTASVNKNSVNLKWDTKTEVNNYGFKIERNTPLNPLSRGDNAANPILRGDERGVWTSIGFVQGHGNSNSPKEYSFSDNISTNGKYSYRLKMIDNDGTYEYSDAVEVAINTTPSEFFADQNYPNPFNPVTTVKYGLVEESMVTIDLYNSIGEKVITLAREPQSAGVHLQKIDCTRLANGIYILNIRVEGGNQVKNKSIKMILLK